LIDKAGKIYTSEEIYKEIARQQRLFPITRFKAMHHSEEAGQRPALRTSARLSREGMTCSAASTDLQKVSQQRTVPFHKFYSHKI